MLKITDPAQEPMRSCELQPIRQQPERVPRLDVPTAARLAPALLIPASLPRQAILQVERDHDMPRRVRAADARAHAALGPRDVEQRLGRLRRALVAPAAAVGRNGVRFSGVREPAEVGQVSRRRGATPQEALFDDVASRSQPRWAR